MSLALGLSLATAGQGGDIVPVISTTIAGLSKASTGAVAASVGITAAIAGTSKKSTGSLTGTVTHIFSPADLAGLVAWYRGDLLTTLGGNVSSWTDKSASVNPAVQASALLQPGSATSDSNFNFKGVVEFTSDILSSGASVDLTTGYTIFATWRMTNLKNYNGVFRSAALPLVTGDGVILLVNNGGTLIWGQNDTNDWFWQEISLLSATHVYSVCITHNGTAAGRAIYLNGTDITANGAFGGTFSNIMAPHPIHIGTGAGAADEFLDGRMAEQIVYNTALSPTDIDQVNAYLQTRYANY